MIELTEIVKGFDASVALTLPYEKRIRSRQRVLLDDGREAGLLMPRGTILRDGDCLFGGDGTTVVIHAAPEPVSTIHSDDSLLLARACYHLGNRHVPLQITAHWVRYQHDHVLDDMVRQMGLEVVSENAPFEPEGGAYSGGGHHHHEH